MEEIPARRVAARVRHDWSDVRLQLKGSRPIPFLEFDRTLASFVEKPREAE